MSKHPARTIEFPAEARHVRACSACERVLPRRVRFCPYCAVEQVEKAPPVAHAKAEDNIIVAEFGFRDVEQIAPPAPQSVPPTPPPPPAPPKPVSPSIPKLIAKTAPSPAPPPVAEQEIASPPQAPTHPTSPSATHVGRRRGFIVFYAVLFVFVVLILVSLLREPGGPSPPSPDPVAQVAVPVTVYALRDDTVVRNQPTAMGSYSPGNLHRGDEVTGEWQAPNAAGYRWLKITTGQWTGDYVWDRNLADSPPPALLKIFNTFETTDAPAEIYPQPDLNATKLETVGPGRRVFVSGEIEGGWYEIRLRRGGVGYALATDFR